MGETCGGGGRAAGGSEWREAEGWRVGGCSWASPFVLTPFSVFLVESQGVKRPMHYSAVLLETIKYIEEETKRNRDTSFFE